VAEHVWVRVPVQRVAVAQEQPAAAVHMQGFSAFDVSTPHEAVSHHMFPQDLRPWLVAILLVSLGWCVHQRNVEHRLSLTAPVPELPLQKSVSLAAFERDGYAIKPVASYVIRANLLSTERYRLGREADLSPVDFALGWGPMSDNALLQTLSVSQGGRWFHVSWAQPPSVEPLLLFRSAANTHILPADDRVRAQVLRVRSGEVVRLKGFLVEVTHPDGWHWSSSLSREDTGAGSCEVMWVTDVLVE